MPESASFLAVEELDAAETLAAVEAGVRDRRAVEAGELELALHWAELHGHDPREVGPVEAQPTLNGRPRAGPTTSPRPDPGGRAGSSASLVETRLPGQQLSLAHHRWRGPHGLYRVVDATGTHPRRDRGPSWT
jgi:hypothetical protein